ncbi:DUF2079 domain-containing protein [Okeania sp.]|uniref:DUF2079 domain-containing protein n=1 Tax=Okeania sp. TaxID=3100323 RepID=UPI002B4AFE62|nr:DUF2079 domain-containing protein [Okeania sp.]MEB3342480.1 DUF2079 domain-containing protein [Okeania sp.]
MIILKQLKSNFLLQITIIAAIILFLCSSVRHLLFQSTAFEMGIYDQVTYLISQGLPPFSSFLEVHHLGNHAAWAMYPVALLYKIYPSVYWLLLIQAISLAIGTLPTWSLARYSGLNKQQAFAIVIVYLLYPVVFNLNLFDFHPEVMALPAILGAILAAKLDKILWFCIAIIWVLGCKDALSLTVAAMGFWLYFFEKKRVYGAIALFAGVAWFIIVTQMLIPYFKDGKPPGGVGRYGYLGNSIPEILLNLFLRPELVFGRLISLKTLEYLLLLNMPIIWWLALRYLTPLIAASPVLAMNILSDIDAQRDLIHQYSLPILPFLLMAVIYTIADGKCGLWYWLWNLRRSQENQDKNISTIVSNCLPKFIIIWSCIGFLALAKYGYFWSIYLDDLDTWQATRNAISLVQTKGGVLTTSKISPHLTHRQFIKLIVEEEEFPRNEILAEYDYILVNVRYPGWKSSQEYSVKLVDKLKLNSEFQLSYQQDDVYLFTNK